MSTNWKFPSVMYASTKYLSLPKEGVTITTVDDIGQWLYQSTWAAIDAITQCTHSGSATIGFVQILPYLQGKSRTWCSWARQTFIGLLHQVQHDTKIRLLSWATTNSEAHGCTGIWCLFSNNRHYMHFGLILLEPVRSPQLSGRPYFSLNQSISCITTNKSSQPSTKSELLL